MEAGRGKANQLYKKELKDLQKEFKQLKAKASKQQRKQIEQEYQIKIEELDQKYQFSCRSNEDNIEGNIQSQITPIEQPFKQSRALKRRLKKQEDQRIKEQSYSNEPSLRQIEIEAILKHLPDNSYRIHEIRADGNCLFRAIQHQIQQQLNLRELAIQWINNNWSIFTEYITDETQREYNDRMSQDGEWGGWCEIVALSQALNKKIQVYSADGVNEVGDGDILRISHHKHFLTLGEHFNSIVN